MKKTIAILLVAVLAVGSVFAGFSGSASVSAGYNFETKDWGFFGNNTGVKLDVELSSAVAEKAGEGNIYASIKASLAIHTVTTSWDEIAPDTIWAPVKLAAKISEAKISAENWSVSILGLADQPDFAKSAIDSYKKEAKDDWGYTKADKKVVPVSYKMDYAKAPGLEVTYADYTVGFGVKHVEKDDDAKKVGTTVTGYAKTPEYDLEGLKAQVAVAGSRGNDDVNNIGVSAKGSYATDVISASVAADLGFKIAEETTVGADVAVNAKYDFVTVDGYYATEAVTDKNDGTTKNLLSAKVATDLNGFNVPVTLAVTGKNLINTQDLSAEVKAAVAEGLTVKANGGYVIKSKELSVGGGVEYAADAFKASANVGFSTVIGTDSSNVLTLDAAVESNVLVPGATLKLAYGAAKKDQNLLADQAKAQNFGKVVASATIKF